MPWYKRNEERKKKTKWLIDETRLNLKKKIVFFSSSMEWYLPAIDGGISNFPTSDGGMCNLPASNPYLYATIPGWPGTRN